MEQAVGQAAEAASFCRKEDHPSYESNIKYLSYWLNLIQMRYELLKKNLRGCDRALALLDAARQNTEYFADLESIFPNRFYSIEDLSNEALFIAAYRSFLSHDFKSCASNLNQWIDRSKAFEGTWRYNNVKVRFLVSEFLDLLASVASSIKDRQEILHAIRRTIRHEPVGLACLELINQAELMEHMYASGFLGEAQRSSIFQIMTELFPLDAHPEEIKSLGVYEKYKYDQFEVLPRYFAETFQTALQLADRNLPEECGRLLNDFLRAFLVIANEYHYSKANAFKNADWFKGLPANLKVEFEHLTLEELANSLVELIRALWNKYPSDTAPFTRLIAFIAELRSQTMNAEKSLAYVRDEVVNKLSRSVFPHIVSVEDEHKLDADTVEYRVRRLWKRGIPAALVLHGKTNNGKTIKLRRGNFYYLRPRWKRYGYRRFSLDQDDFQAYPAKLLAEVDFVTSDFVPGAAPWEGDVSELLKSDEGSCLEFKPSEHMPEGRDIIEWVIAFGNNYPEGGKLILGVLERRDPRTNERIVEGFPVTERFVNGLYSKVLAKSEPLVPFKVFRASRNGTDFAVIQFVSFDDNALEPYVLKTKDQTRAETFFRDGASTIRYTGFKEVMAKFRVQKEASVVRGK